MINELYMLDKDFLSELDKYHHREVFAKVITLDINENPLEEIEGVITSGSINIDGTSAVRRTCNLTMVVKDSEIDISNYHWGLNTKIRLYVGLKNKINNDYPEIIWFKQGIYVINTLNISQSINNLTITIGGKDKMCLLNGEVGGAINSLTVDFSYYYEYDTNGYLSKVEIPIKNIIYEVVHNYAKELMRNIIINDVEDHGFELLEYRGSKNIYYLTKAMEEGNDITNMIINPSKIYYLEDGSAVEIGKIEHYMNLVPNLRTEEATKVYASAADALAQQEDKAYYVIKIEPGQNSGYRIVDLTYPGELIGQIGGNICTQCLDKIASMLGNFEYFYNVDGQFVFQRKKTAVRTQTGIKNDSVDRTSYVDYDANVSTTEYNFADSVLITAFSNSPNLANLKNDFSIWGKKKGIGGADIPIHLRYAIDKKPSTYTTITVSSEEAELYAKQHGFLYGEGGVQPQAGGQIYMSKDAGGGDDWREVIYQMAKDYDKWNHLDDFEYKIVEANGNLYPNGITGYEHYYTDLISFWRLLYNPDIIPATEPQAEFSTYYTIGTDPVSNKLIYEPIAWDDAVVKKDLQFINPADAPDQDYYIYEDGYRLVDLADEYSVFDKNTPTIYTAVDIEETDKDGVVTKKTIYEPFNICAEDCIIYAYNPMTTNYDELKSLREFSDTRKYYIKTLEGFKEYNIYKFANDSLDYYDSNEFNLNDRWSKQILESPESLVFWFDFLDGNNSLEKYSVKVVGDRPKAVNDDKVTSIYFQDTPTVVVVDKDKWDDLANKENGYVYIRLSKSLENLFSISAAQKSAWDVLESLLDQHCYCIESVNITAIPVYYLEPNTKIEVHDMKSGIDGEYLVSRITLPLTYNGTMSITATKAVSSNYYGGGEEAEFDSDDSVEIDLTDVPL